MGSLRIVQLVPALPKSYALFLCKSEDGLPVRYVDEVPFLALVSTEYGSEIRPIARNYIGGSCLEESLWSEGSRLLEIGISREEAIARSTPGAAACSDQCSWEEGPGGIMAWYFHHDPTCKLWNLA